MRLFEKADNGQALLLVGYFQRPAPIATIPMLCVRIS